MSDLLANPANDPAARPLEAAGDCIGPWRLLRQVGEGDWSYVYQARPAEGDPHRPGDYAVKLLKPQFESHPGYVGLFQREDWVGRRVSHRHLSPVLASSLKRAPYWLALPFLEGVSLEARLATGGPLPPAGALWVVRQVAEAADALHQAGWLHGDIKPHNILLSPHGHATLIDLGFARPIDPAVVREIPGSTAETLAATPAYAAPETFHESPHFGPANDVYSLGATLFECLTGRRPFESNSITVLADAHQRHTPSDIRRFKPSTPASVADLVWHLLAKDPAFRPTGQRMLDHLVSLEIETFDRRVA